MEKTLIIVDCQYDFCNPLGSLYVKGAVDAVFKIAKIIPEFDRIIFTADWHPTNHCSFNVNGGEWPVHCVQYSLGASIAPELYDKCMRYKDKSIIVITKGEAANTEEYGMPINSYISSLIHNNDVVICGIAGDYCVLNSIDNLLKHSIKPKVYLDGIASIDDGSTLNKFINKNNLEEYVFNN